MTKNLFWENPYQVEFDGKVALCQGDRLILDQTCFYPRGGGQVGDTGEIGGVRVLDTVKDESNEVVHILEKEAAFKEGEKVHGRIDWERRYRIMRLHSAAHLVSYLMKETFGEACKPASSGLLDENKDRSDYTGINVKDGVELRERLKIVEEKANRLVEAGGEVKTWTDETGQRLWEFKGYPVMACGGTHIRNLREVGRIQVRRGSKPGAGRERIEISLV
jgi:alanyl-tRNA synthetase